MTQHIDKIWTRRHPFSWFLQVVFASFLGGDLPFPISLKKKHWQTSKNTLIRHVLENTEIFLRKKRKLTML